MSPPRISRPRPVSCSIARASLGLKGGSAAATSPTGAWPGTPWPKRITGPKVGSVLTHASISNPPSTSGTSASGGSA